MDGRLSVASFWGMASAVLVSGWQSLTAIRTGRTVPDGGTGMIDALIDGARSTLGIVAVCACAGIIVSIVNLTGLGLTIISKQAATRGATVEFDRARGGGARTVLHFEPAD